MPDPGTLTEYLDQRIAALEAGLDERRAQRDALNALVRDLTATVAGNERAAAELRALRAALSPPQDQTTEGEPTATDTG